jgi:hypothetical protein
MGEGLSFVRFGRLTSASEKRSLATMHYQSVNQLYPRARLLRGTDEMP